MTVSESRAQNLFDQANADVCRRTDRLLVVVLLVGWIAQIFLACHLSPYTWAGTTSRVHIHVWYAFGLGGLLVAFPLWWVCQHPAAVPTRHILAIAQMLSSALLIHLTGGRLDSHFSVFGSLAILSIYRDWRILITASVVMAVDHFARGMFWPQSIYGVDSGASWRWLEHSGWVGVFDCFLVYACWRQQQEMWVSATKQAAIEELKCNFEQRVVTRTQQLRDSELRFRTLAKCSTVGIFQTDKHDRCVYVNDRLVL